MVKIDEIAPDVYRLSIYVPQLDMQFNHFLVRDEASMLFHAGLRAFFAELRDALATLITPASLRWIGWSHFESDECGALNSWLGIAPAAEPICTLTGKLVSVDDFSNKPARGMVPDEVLTTGKHRLRFCTSPHIPHGWDAGLVFDETHGILFCSDLFHHFGNVEPVTESDLIDRTRQSMELLRSGPLVGYMPYTPHTEAILNRLAALKPTTLATMHGSSFSGDCARALRELGEVIQEAFGAPEQLEPATAAGTSQQQQMVSPTPVVTD